MINPRHFIYSKAAIARMRGVAISMVKRIEIWANCIFVIIDGCRPKFYSKFSFRNHFVDWRKEQSKLLNCDRYSHDESKFLVTNGFNRTHYDLKATTEGVVCECDDYLNQKKYLGKPGVCKHGYAVLAFLGFEKLSDYIEHHRWCVNW